jgi:predicted DNA-binding protein with PD1-like motif
MKIHALRLLPGADLKVEIQNYLKKENIEAAAMLSSVGSLRQTKIRLAGAKDYFEENGLREILSLSGTLSLHGSHLHIALSNGQGQCIGGHLMDGCLINTTAELVIGEIPTLVFKRTADASTGYAELQVEEKSP